MEIDSSGNVHDYCEDCNRFRKMVDYPDYRCRECFLKLMRAQHKLFLWTVDDWQTWCKANNEPMPRFKDGIVLEESRPPSESRYTQRDLDMIAETEEEYNELRRLGDTGWSD
jgi:hypothetical protein